MLRRRGLFVASSKKKEHNMKIKEIISEGSYRWNGGYDGEVPDGGDVDLVLDKDDPEYDPDYDEELEPLETDVSDSAEQAVIDTVRELIRQGSSEVETVVLTNKVVEATHEPFLPADLVALFKESDMLQRYIDKIDPNKVKFSTDILTATSEKGSSNKSGGTDKTATIRSMAARAASRRGK